MHVDLYLYFQRQVKMNQQSSFEQAGNVFHSYFLPPSRLNYTWPVQKGFL